MIRRQQWLLGAVGALLIAFIAASPNACEPPPNWTVEGRDLMTEHRGNVTVVVLLNAACQLCLWQAARFELLYNQLLAVGHTNLSLVIVNSQYEPARSQLDNLKKKVNLIPVYQETEEEPVWDPLDGNKDDVFVYDRCGRLTYYIPLPLSLLNKPFVFSAIWRTYEFEPCGSCNPSHESNKSNEDIPVQTKESDKQTEQEQEEEKAKLTENNKKERNKQKQGGRHLHLDNKESEKRDEDEKEVKPRLRSKTRGRNHSSSHDHSQHLNFEQPSEKVDDKKESHHKKIHDSENSETVEESDQGAVHQHHHHLEENQTQAEIDEHDESGTNEHHKHLQESDETPKVVLESQEHQSPHLHLENYPKELEKEDDEEKQPHEEAEEEEDDEEETDFDHHLNPEEINRQLISQEEDEDLHKHHHEEKSASKEEKSHHHQHLIEKTEHEVESHDSKSEGDKTKEHLHLEDDSEESQPKKINMDEDNMEKHLHFKTSEDRNSSTEMKDEDNDNSKENLKEEKHSHRHHHGEKGVQRKQRDVSRRGHDFLTAPKETLAETCLRFDLKQCPSWRSRLQLAKQCCHVNSNNRISKLSSEKCEPLTRKKCKRLLVVRNCCRQKDTLIWTEPQRCQGISPPMCKTIARLGFSEVTCCEGVEVPKVFFPLTSQVCQHLKKDLCPLFINYQMKHDCCDESKIAEMQEDECDKVKACVACRTDPDGQLCRQQLLKCPAEEFETLFRSCCQQCQPEETQVQACHGVVNACQEKGAECHRHIKLCRDALMCKCEPLH